MSAMLKTIKANKYFFMGLLLLAIVFMMNIFPDGYIFSGGDTMQLIEAKDNLSVRFYEWGGRAATFYSIFYFLDLIGMDDTAQLSFYLAIFILGSYISFFVFSKIFLKTTDLIRTVSSLFYALNLFTLYVFTANWGFSYFLSLYIFVPALTGLFIGYLERSEKKFLLIFGIVLFFSSSGFGNSAFFISFIIFLTVIFLALLATRTIKWDLNLVKKSLLLFLITLAVNMYWLLPLIPQMKSGVESLNTSNVLELNWFINHTANPILNTLSLKHYSDDYFPFNFIYSDGSFLKNIFILLSFMPILLIAGGFLLIKKFSEFKRKYFLMFLIVLAVFIALVARVTPPFETINHFIYNIWGMNTLRGYDKTAVFIPFVFTALLLIILTEINSRKTIIFLAALLLVIPMPFYTGRIQQNLSYRFSHTRVEKKDYQKSKLSFLVKIPKEYYEIRDEVNNNKTKSFIATLPVSRNDGSGTVSYPRWKFYGVDVTKMLYDKKYIEANRLDLTGWKAAEDFKKEQNDSKWMIKLLGMMGAEYIIFHKDVEEENRKASQWKMEIFEKDGLIEKKQDNEYFTLYRISDQYFIPYVSWQNNKFNLDGNPELIIEKLDDIKENSQSADFKEINPKKYIVNLDDGASENLIFSENYDPNWKAYHVDATGKKIKIKDHFIARGYANGWGIKPSSDTKQVLIEYYPTKLMWKGIVISLATLFLLIYLLIKKHCVDKKRTD